MNFVRVQQLELSRQQAPSQSLANKGRTLAGFDAALFKMASAEYSEILLREIYAMSLCHFLWSFLAI
jgi:hypothetical protein